MVERTGRRMRLMVGDGATAEAFNVLAGLQGKTLSINNEIVDITTADDGINRNLLSGAGLRTFTISGNGVFKDDLAIQDTEGYARDGSIQSFQIEFLDPTDAVVETWDFEAQVASFEYNAEHNVAQLYTFTLEVAGAVSIT